MRINHKLLPKHHTGKLRHRHHTSYGSLALVILLAGTITAAASRSMALAAATDPVTGQESVYAVVPAPAPTASPVITNLAAGTIINTSEPVDLRGNCPPNTLVKVFKNTVLGGSALCQNGQFSVNVDLFFGSNSLTLAAYNANNVPGPLSTPLNVTRPLPQAPGNTDAYAAAGQFFLTSDAYYRGVKVGQALEWSVMITGGQAPYALNVGWGDGTSDLISRGTAGSFTIRHTYKKSGSGSPANFPVTIQASDQAGDKTFLQLASIVTGDQTGLATSIKHGYDLSEAIRIAWQALAVLVLVLIAFWLGERREKFIIKKSGMRKAW